MPEIDIETAIIGAGQAGVRLARALAADGRGVALGIRVRHVEVDFPAVMDRARRPASRDPSLCYQSTMRISFASRHSGEYCTTGNREGRWQFSLGFLCSKVRKATRLAEGFLPTIRAI